mgnify:FL=1
MGQWRLVSWNVNGLRAIEKKGFVAWLGREKYDVVALQETKVSRDTKLSAELIQPDGYRSSWDYASEKRGYSGVVVYSRPVPARVSTTFGRYDILAREGRMLELDYGDFIFLNIYFPNGGSGPARLKYKLDFYQQFLDYLGDLRRSGRQVIFAGDVNTAHKEIDLARPKENANTSGFLLAERQWLDRFVAVGFVDTFRLFQTGGDHYSWWDQKTRARDRNVCWRIDYFFVSADLVPKVRDAFILSDVLGSDHAPVGLILDL